MLNGKGFFGEGPAMERVRLFLRRAAATDVPVLLLGETGTGKTLLARLIHAQGRRRRAPLIALNCAGIPDGLFESELFGHRRGAFTGAIEARRGLLEAAHQGTLFLDEVGDLPARQQGKLLTVLEDGQVRRVGEEQPRDVDLRLISATVRDLRHAIGSGGFRADLFHRISLLRCTLPPLRDRRGDIPELAARILAEAGKRHGCPRVELTDEGMALLLRHPWPGNVREMAHTLEAALILAEGGVVDRGSLLAAMDEEADQEGTGESRTPPPPGTHSARSPTDPDPTRPRPSPPPDPTGTGHAEPLPERERIRRALAEAGGNQRKAAQVLGISPSTLRKRILRLDLTAVE
jgi:transcriptional regulator with GAF, ATPase, and Fis domain